MKLRRERDESSSVMRLTFGDTHFWNYELGFSAETKAKEEDEEEEVEGDGAGTKRHVTIQLLATASSLERLRLCRTHAEAGISYR